LRAARRDVSFLLEDAELRAHGRVARVALQIAHHLARRRTPAAVEDIHDLALAAAQLVRRDHVLFL
jgi:hypothetical protein